MRVLVTGGAGFIGRWVVKKLLDNGHEALAMDNLSNGSEANLSEFKADKNFKGLIKGDITDRAAVKKAFEPRPDICIHAAAQINVQDSLNNPEKNYRVNVEGTFNILEEALKHKTKVCVIGTCMVYDTAGSRPISELHPVKPASPYAGTKIAAEELALSYYHGLGLPVTILRPFNTYGPFQKSNMEGGVVSIFIKKAMNGEKLIVFGDGTQTRDLLYAEDCADFIVNAAFSEKAVGQVFNAGTGKDIKIKDLAAMIAGDKSKVEFVKHHHPQAEIMKLCCDPAKAKKVLGWSPRVSLNEGIKRTTDWIKSAC